MKSTKRILSAILSLCMILGCLAVGFTAQASAADLVDAIAAGGDVNWTGGDVTLEDTLKITGDVNVDLNGAVITGPEGKNAVEINGNVKLYDGVVIANNKSYSGEMGFVKSLLNYKPAISVNGGNVVLECVTAVGSLIRVPNSSSVEVPVGNGINANKGNVTLKNVIAVGMNALDNDNISSNVVVEDAILVGVYKAVNRSERVDFCEDTHSQYKTVDFLEAFLADGVTLSANEKKYIDAATNSEGDISVASVLVNVADPSYNELTSEYVNGTLNVYAQADLANEVEGVSNRYSYAYVPATCTVDGQEAAFELADGQYVASFTGLAENEEFEAKADYDLSIKMGKKQKELVSDALGMIASYVERAPELLYRFIKDFESAKVKVEDIAGIFYNALNDELTKDMFDLPEVESLILAIFGETYKGANDGYDSPLEKVHAYPLVQKAIKSGNYEAACAAIAQYRLDDAKLVFDTNDDGVADSLYAYTDNSSYTKDEFYVGKPGFGSGIGLLEMFDVYYDDTMELLYGGTTDTFADLEGAAAYLGDNFDELYELVVNAVELVKAACEVVEDNRADVEALLEHAGYGSYVDNIDQVLAYAEDGAEIDQVMAKADEMYNSKAAATYLKDGKGAEYCSRYAKKVWNIANNLDTYFDIDVKGDYVAVDFGHFTTGTVNTNVQTKKVKVEVYVSGQGAATLNGAAVSVKGEGWFDIGEDITVEGVATTTGCNLAYIVVKTNGGSNIVNASSYTAKAATNIEINVVFQNVADVNAGLEQVTFMTDKALGYKYITTITLDSAEVIDLWEDSTMDIVAPEFKGLTLTGWSLDKDGAEKVASVAALADAVDAVIADGAVMVYAIYDYEEKVEVDTHEEAAKMNGASVEGNKVYFEVSFQLKDGVKAVEAGIIATKNAALATEDAMVVELSGTAGVAFLRTIKVDADGYVMQNVLYRAGIKTASGTVYGRGYVVYEDGTVEYTDIASGTVA